MTEETLVRKAESRDLEDIVAIIKDAKALLKAKGLSYREVHFDVGQPKQEGEEYVNVAEFKARYPQVKTAPQIFEDTDYVGGFPELRARLG